MHEQLSYGFGHDGYAFVGWLIVGGLLLLPVVQFGFNEWWRWLDRKRARITASGK